MAADDGRQGVGGMAFLEINDLHFTYPEMPHKTLSGVSLTVGRGEFVVLCGPSGCGKTTLLRHMKAELAPHGHAEGAVFFRGLPFAEHDAADLARQIGFVQQDPENQIVMERVLQELSFGLENSGVPTDAMRRRIAEMASFFGLEDLLYRKTGSLSGGQKQLVNLAAILLLQPELLLLDEPTAQLDPVAAKAFLQLLQRLNEEFGLTVIVTEHRLEQLFPIADRVVVLDRQGGIKYDGTPQAVIRQVHQAKDELVFDYLPSFAKLFLSLQPERDVPLTVKEGRAALERLAPSFGAASGVRETAVVRDAQASAEPQPMLECRELDFQYERNGRTILRQLELTVNEHDFLAVVGGNGTGKSTLLQLMSGLLRPYRGTIRFRGTDLKKLDERERWRSIGYLSQNPRAYFLEDTVGEEIRQAVARSRLPDAEELHAKLDAILGLEAIRSMHPYDVSGGELQKAALACVLLAGPKLLLLDEPTKGLDPLVKRDWGMLLQTLHREGLTIVLVTHDIEFAAGCASRCAMLFDGVIASEGPPAKFFAENVFYTTELNRLVRNFAPDALTYREVLHRWLGRRE